MSINKHVIAYRSVDEALRLDANGFNELALKQYLKSISTVVDALLQDAENEAYPNDKNKNTKKLLTIAKQCFDRIGEIGEILPLESNKHSKRNCQSFEKQKKRLDLTLFPDIKMPDESTSNLMDMSVTTLDLMPSSSIDIYANKSITISPLDQVKRENKQLLAAYKARLLRTQTPTGKINLQLALQRRLAENATLAMTKEKVLAHRHQEAQKRLLEQAARKIGNKNILGSKEEASKKELYTKIIQYEQKMEWPQVLKRNLSVNPLNFDQIDVAVRQILSVSEHPISVYLQRQQYTIYDKVIQLISRCPFAVNDFSDRISNVNRDRKSSQYVAEEAKKRIRTLCRSRSESLRVGTLPEFAGGFEIGEDLDSHLASEFQFDEKIDDIVLLEEEALQRHLQYIVIDVRCSLEKLLNIMLLTYESLDSPEGRDQCYSSMEESFFKPLWPYLITLFRLAYKSEEKKLNEIMINHANKTLKDLCVSKNYWSDEEVPYKKAIVEMTSILTQCCPLKKLETLVRVAHLVCQSSDESKPMGADDLIPVLCFVVLRTRSPQLITECHAMEEFIHECYLMGEEGYCLTTMQTALQYLNTLLPTKLT